MDISFEGVENFSKSNQTIMISPAHKLGSNSDCSKNISDSDSKIMKGSDSLELKNKESAAKPKESNSDVDKVLKKGSYSDRRDKTPSPIQKRKFKNVPGNSKKRYSFQDKNRVMLSGLSQEAYKPQNVESLLSLAVTEQEKIVQTVQENLQQDCLQLPDSVMDFCNVELDEIFYVWVNLFYFIISLKMHLFEMMKDEGLKQNIVAERDIILQALECSKMFSIFKIKRLTEALSKVCSAQSSTEGNKEMEGEGKLASRFVTDMIFMASKTKDMIHQIKNKKKNPKHVSR